MYLKSGGALEKFRVARWLFKDTVSTADILCLSTSRDSRIHGLLQNETEKNRREDKK